MLNYVLGEGYVIKSDALDHVEVLEIATHSINYTRLDNCTV